MFMISSVAYFICKYPAELHISIISINKPFPALSIPTFRYPPNKTQILPLLYGRNFAEFIICYLKSRWKPIATVS